jgi:hypothetical protein
MFPSNRHPAALVTDAHEPLMTVDALAGIATAIRPSPVTKANVFTRVAPLVNTNTVYDL